MPWNIAWLKLDSPPKKIFLPTIPQKKASFWNIAWSNRTKVPSANWELVKLTSSMKWTLAKEAYPVNIASSNPANLLKTDPWKSALIKVVPEKSIRSLKFTLRIFVNPEISECVIFRGTFMMQRPSSSNGNFNSRRSKFPLIVIPS